MQVLAGIGILIFLFNVPKTIKQLRIFARHLPVDGAIRGIAVALKNALCDAGLLDTAKGSLRIQSLAEENGSFQISMSGGTFHESSVFADCLAEVLMPIKNPRYLIVRQGYVLGLQRDDYHAVPTVLGLRKDRAEIFLKAWSRYVGPGQLIYTRSATGRTKLLSAKSRAFSSTFSNEVKREDRWQ